MTDHLLLSFKIVVITHEKNVEISANTHGKDCDTFVTTKMWTDATFKRVFKQSNAPQSTKNIAKQKCFATHRKCKEMQRKLR